MNDNKKRVVKSITGFAGDGVMDIVDTYLALQEQGYTADYTVIDINGNMYPVGYFDRTNIDLFKLGVITTQNIRYLYNDLKYTQMDKYEEQRKLHSDYFINELMDKYEDGALIPSVVNAFDNLCEKYIGVHMFDEEQKNYVKSASEEKRSRTM